MSKRRVLKGTLRCTDECGHKVSITLMENNQGVFKVHHYLCADCGCNMVMEVEDDSKQKSISKNSPQIVQ
jgi:hypothetical protein